MFKSTMAQSTGTMLLFAVSITLFAFVSFGANAKILKITTPEQFDQFTTGEIGAGYDYVHIYAGAHPNVLSLPKVFAYNTTVREFRFEDENENVIYVDTGLNRVEATLNKGKNLIVGLPGDYITYDLELLPGATLSADDYAYIFTWTSALYLQIYDKADVANELLNYTNEMRPLEKLQILKLRLQLDTYEKVQVRPFVVALPKLVILDFQIKGFSESQARRFMSNQKNPPFRGVLYMQMCSVMYSKT